MEDKRNAISPMACGNCGHGHFLVFANGPVSTGGLLIECAKCHSVSTITVTQPHLSIGWGDTSDGILCQMTPKTP